MVVVLSFCAAFILFYWQFVGKPVRQEISNIEVEIRRLREIEYKLKEIVIRYKNFDKFVGLTGDRLQDAQNFLPQEMNHDKFIVEIYKAAENNNVRINSVQVGEISTVKLDEKNSSREILRQSVKVQLESEYIPLLNFIREVADGERLTTLENTLITGEENNFLNCDLEFFIYAEKPAQ